MVRGRVLGGIGVLLLVAAGCSGGGAATVEPVSSVLPTVVATSTAPNTTLPGTTVPGTTAPPVPVPTSTTLPPTTTTSPVPLALTADSFAGVALGTPMAEAEARLVARLGPPRSADEWRPRCSILGSRPEWRALWWGEATVVFERAAPDAPAVLVHYRFGELLPDHGPLPAASTPSGVHVGTTLAELRAAGVSIAERGFGSMMWFGAQVDGLLLLLVTPTAPGPRTTEVPVEGYVDSIGTDSGSCE